MQRGTPGGATVPPRLIAPSPLSPIRTHAPAPSPARVSVLGPWNHPVFLPRRVFMQRVLWAGLAGLSCAALLVAPRSASAFRIMLPPPTVSQRVSTADTVLLGKVTSIEEKLVK